VFAIDPAQATLTLVEHVSTQGKTPRDFSLDPTGRYLFAPTRIPTPSSSSAWTPNPAA